MRPDGRTAARALHAKGRVYVILVHSCQTDIHIERIHIELFPNQGGEASSDALPHLRAGGIKADGVVRENLQEGVRGPSTLGAHDRQRCGRP